MPVFRHAVLLRGAPGASAESLEDMIDIAITECERFYPAFQFVIWGGKSARDAISASLLDTVGTHSRRTSAGARTRSCGRSRLWRRTDCASRMTRRCFSFTNYLVE